MRPTINALPSTDCLRIAIAWAYQATREDRTIPFATIDNAILYCLASAINYHRAHPYREGV